MLSHTKKFAGFIITVVLVIPGGLAIAGASYLLNKFCTDKKHKDKL